MAPSFVTPNPLPKQQPILPIEIQTVVTKAQVSLAKLNQLVTNLPNPKILVRPILRKEAYGTSALEGIFTDYKKLVIPTALAETDKDLLEVRNFINLAELCVDSVLLGKKIEIKFIEKLHAQLFAGIPEWQNKSGQLRRINVQIENRGGYVYFPMQHGPNLRVKLKQLFDWFAGTKEWDPIVAIAFFHYQFEILHPFEDGNGRLGRLIAILQLHQKELLEYPILDVSTWLKDKKILYHSAFQKVTENGDWGYFVGVIAAAIKNASGNLILEINQLLALQASERAKVQKAFRAHSRAMEVMDYLMIESVFTVPEICEKLGISYKSANALVSKMVAIGSLIQLGDSAYERQFTNKPLLDYANNGF